MLTTSQKAKAVVIAAWAKMPRLVADCIHHISIRDLGATNGGFVLGEKRIELNFRLFEEVEGGDIQLIDDYGNFIPQSGHIVSRALHTTLHEMSHAIGVYTGLHSDPEWISLSGWMVWPHQQTPPSHSRYVENRDGWEKGPSEWIHYSDAWFARPYASKSPYEDFADSMALRALNWQHRFDTPNGKKKLQFLESRIWGKHTFRKSACELYDRVMSAANAMPWDYEDAGRMRYRRLDRRTYLPIPEDMMPLPRKMKH